MDIVLLRHGRAEERAEFARTGGDDAERPLTAEGRRRMARAVRGLRTVLPAPTLIAASPLLRAVQTAHIVADGYGLGVVEWPELAPGHGPSEVVGRLAGVTTTVLLVGHEPDLGALGSWLLSGAAASFLPLKKGGACCIECPGAPAAGTGRLRWLFTPRQLRLLGG